MITKPRLSAVCLLATLAVTAVNVLAHPGHEPMTEPSAASAHHILTSPYHLSMLALAIGIPLAAGIWALRSAKGRNRA
jgi:hydrogenase/urease accessory protein HupE